ncbi:hypothetical protein MKEN_00502100 [Mycena kentingensis (nom. inval.)]|nr:hypothetical protein MKEN_00502100 [Mycena kentingensis (nom. inval.)]
MSSSSNAVVLRLKLDVMRVLAIRALRLSPTLAKYAALILALLNIGSWPLVWHLRVFSCVMQARLSFNALKLRHLFSGRATWKLAVQNWHESRMPIGVHPLRKVWTYKWSVGIHDSDFLLHMSNSSYAATLDRSRMHLALATFPTLLRAGGFAPLAAMHYSFIREIPMFARYEIRASVGAWDQKWLYVVFRFVLPASRTGKAKESSPIAGTPMPPANGNGGGDTDPDAVMKALAARAMNEPEPDGASLCTIVVNRFCYKLGRISVPPAVVLASNGFYADRPSAASAQAGSPTPPPYWDAHVRPLVASVSQLRKFFAGGWRDIPEGQRWWEDAFSAVEDERKARLVTFGGGKGLSDAMEVVKDISRPT